MNGRLYDPKLHRFLQTDNYVQDPGNTQNYNRYGYVLNNPLKYTDPSGWETEEEKAKKAQHDEEERLKNEYARAYAEEYGRQFGADGITSQQWMNLGGAGVNSQLYSSYVSQNRDEYNSGLNYGMDKITIHSNADEWLRSGGYDPKGNISDMDENARDSYVKMMVKNVYPADILYGDAGNPNIKYDSAINGYGNYMNKEVTIYDKAFTTNKDLFLTIMHEGSHAWDDYHGLTSAWGENSRDITETRAYEMMHYFDSNVFNNGDHSHYYDFYSNRANESDFNNFRIRSYIAFFNNIQR